MRHLNEEEIIMFTIALFNSMKVDCFAINSVVKLDRRRLNSDFLEEFNLIKVLEFD